MRKKSRFIIFFLIASICILIFMLNDRTKLMANRKQSLQNIYERSLYDTANYLHDVSNLLSKLKLTRSPKQNINLFAQIWHSASAAHDSLSRLPYDHDLISKTLKYLSQTADFSYAMMDKSIDGEELNDDNKNKISELEKYSRELSIELEKILTDLCGTQKTRKTSWDELLDKNISGSALTNSIQNINKQFQNYGELIYDGPFSDHIQKIKPKKLIEEKTVTKEEALNICKKILSEQNIKNIEYSGETTTKKFMQTYNYTVENNFDDKIYIQITKNGGYPLILITEPKISHSQNKIDIETAIKIAKKFLDGNGFKNIQENYYEQFENFLTINFAPCINNIIMYPDLIKIKIDLSNGLVSGLDTSGYLTSNCEREENIPMLSQGLVQDLFPIDLEIKSIGRCVIPSYSQKEIWCYEVNGNLNGESFLIYVNESTGKFEKIYKLIKNERGVLAE